jgi:hypothetical protein
MSQSCSMITAELIQPQHARYSHILRGDMGLGWMAWWRATPPPPSPAGVSRKDYFLMEEVLSGGSLSPHPNEASAHGGGVPTEWTPNQTAFHPLSLKPAEPPPSLRAANDPAAGRVPAHAAGARRSTRRRAAQAPNREPPGRPRHLGRAAEVPLPPAHQAAREGQLPYFFFGL